MPPGLARLLRIAALVSLVALTWKLSVSGVSPGGAASQLFWFLIMFVVVIPVHELGHAVAGALVGHEIKSIVVGTGPRLLAFTVAGVAIQINALPVFGLTMGLPRGTRWVRLRQWTFAAGGKLFAYQSGVLIVGYSYGYFTARDLLRIGWWLTVVEFVILLLLVQFYWPLLGMH